MNKKLEEEANKGKKKKDKKSKVDLYIGVVFKIELTNMSGQFFVPMSADYSIYPTEEEVLLSNWMAYNAGGVDDKDDYM